MLKAEVAACRAYCQPGASFAAQAEPLADMQTLEQYTEWMKGILAVLPDASLLRGRDRKLPSLRHRSYQVKRRGCLPHAVTTT